MSAPGHWAMRWRVRCGYPLALLFFWLAEPVPATIGAGAVVALAGVVVRGRAAGYLRKHEALARAGPYAHTRNPLYLGSVLLGIGMAIAAGSWLVGALFIAYFAVFYPPVMRREAAELRARYAAAFDEYARRVPLFFPRWKPAASPDAEARFDWGAYLRNREWQAAAGALLVLVLLILKWWLR